MLAVSTTLLTETTHDEKGRLAALADLQALDVGPEETFDRIARLTKACLNFPLAYISLIDFDRQILKTHTDTPICDGRRDTAFCSSTIGAGHPLIVTDTLENALFASFPQVRRAPYIRAYWGTPLTTRTGFNVGALCVVDYVPRRPEPEHVALLQDLGRLTVETMELRALATTDVLTGVHSRRAFFAEGRRIFSSRRPEHRKFGCVVFDIDHFKEINDSFGHAIGDDVLRRVGDILRDESRSDTLVGRIGGEEFAIILPGEDIRGAFAFAERLRSSLAGKVAERIPAVTASFGIAERGVDDVELADILNRADREAYVAKSAGRNCTRPLMPSATLDQTRCDAL